MFITTHCWKKCGMCIYSDKHTFIALLTIDKELSLYLTTRIKFRNHECTERQWFGTVGWLVQLLEDESSQVS